MLLAATLSGAASAEPAAGVSSSTLREAAAVRARLLPFAGWAKPTQRVSIMVHVPLRNVAEAEGLAASQSTPRSPLYHHWLTQEQFASRYAPLQSDVRNAAAALRAGGFSVSKSDAQFVYASAPSATVERFFGTRMGLVQDGGRLRVDARTPISLPAPLFKIGATVIGLTALPHPHAAHLVRNRFYGPQAKGKPANQYNGAYFPGELAQVYSEPSYTLGNGTGMKIAIVGLSDSTDSDNQTLWCQYGLGPACGMGGTTLAPYPTVNHFEASGSIPPGSGDDSLEATLDAQMAGGTAPGAIIDQYADSTDDNLFIGAYDYIVNTGHEDFVTTSYLYCELDFVGDVSQLLPLHQVLLQGNLAGQTFMFASGDNGAYGCAFENNFSPSISALAADPAATGVGGTTVLNTTSTDDNLGTNYVSETSHSQSSGDWASGGGVSVIYRAPRFQNLIGIGPRGGRQSPDISMHMGGQPPDTADIIYFPPDGGLIGVIGTSCSSPEFAGSLADIVTAVNASVGNSGGFRLGNVNNFLYYEQAAGNAAVSFRQNIPGDNFVYHYSPTPSTEGYNEVIGLGTPLIPGLAKELGYVGTFEVAGDTFTASNP
jgi:subtilase family serine protease